MTGAVERDYKKMFRDAHFNIHRDGEPRFGMATNKKVFEAPVSAPFILFCPPSGSEMHPVEQKSRRTFDSLFFPVS